MSEKHYVGLDITGFEDNGKTRPISRVTLKLDDENVVTAGDDTGMELVSDCAHGTQAMADAILERMKGYQYQMFSADAANIDPAAELGDGVTVGGVYGVVSRFSDDGSGYPGITAPGEAELEDEYPSVGPLTKEFSRKIAKTYSYINKTAEEIQLGVKNDLDGLSSSIDIKIGSITSQVTGLDGRVSTVEQTAEGLKTSVQGLDGKYSSLSQTVDGFETKVSGLDGKYTQLKQTVDGFETEVSGLDGKYSSLKQTVDGFTFTDAGGKVWISNGSINLSGAISWDDLDYTAQGQVTAAQSMAASASTAAASAQTAVNSVLTYDYQGRTYIDGTKIMTGTVTASNLQGGTVQLLDYMGYAVGTIGIGASSVSGDVLTFDVNGGVRFSTSGYFWVESGHGQFGVGGNGFQIALNTIPNTKDGYSLGTAFYTWSAVYSSTSTIQSSDRSQKHDIEPLPDKYVTMLDNVEIVRYKLNSGTSGRYHLGFISQQVEEAMNAAGVDSVEFGGFVKDRDESGNDIYMLRYEELIAPMLAKIRQLEKRIERLEENSHDGSTERA